MLVRMRAGVMRVMGVMRGELSMKGFVSVVLLSCCVFFRIVGMDCMRSNDQRVWAGSFEALGIWTLGSACLFLVWIIWGLMRLSGPKTGTSACWMPTNRTVI